MLRDMKQGISENRGLDWACKTGVGNEALVFGTVKFALVLDLATRRSKDSVAIRAKAPAALRLKGHRPIGMRRDSTARRLDLG